MICNYIIISRYSPSLMLLLLAAVATTQSSQKGPGCQAKQTQADLKPGEGETDPNDADDAGVASMTPPKKLLGYVWEFLGRFDHPFPLSGGNAPASHGSWLGLDSSH